MLKGNSGSLNKFMRLHFLSYILSYILQILTILHTFCHMIFWNTLITYIVTIHTVLHTWLHNYMYISCIRHVVLIPISHKLSFRVVKMFVIPKILGICVCSAEARYGSREHNDIHWGVYRPTQHVCPDDILLQGDIAGWSGVNCKKIVLS